MQCPQCNTENPEGAKFCFNCGAKLAAVCPQCGATLPPQAKFCFECGSAVEAPAVAAGLPLVLAGGLMTTGSMSASGVLT